MDKTYFVYILASKYRGITYVGITSDLENRIRAHKDSVANGFTKKYFVKKLVYWEEYSCPNEAIAREKRLKRWNRKWKFELIEKNNKKWDDLAFLII